jgi:predicted O-linked N-acetylglucosamine transferase (SPINDLY family)
MVEAPGTPSSSSPHAEPTLLARAQEHANQNRWGEAARLYRELLAQAPGDVAALEGLGLAALHGERAAEGLVWLQRAAERDPSNARVLAHLGIALKRNGRLEDAIAVYRRAIELDPQPSTLLNLGRAERAAGRVEASIATFRRALELKRDSPEAWSMLSNALRQAGRSSEALDAAREAQRMDPWLGEGHLNAGVALHQLGQLVEAAVCHAAASTFASSRRAALGNLKVALADPRLAPLVAVTTATTSAAARALPAAAPAAPSTLGSLRLLLEAPDDVAALEALGSSERAAQRLPTAIALLERAAQLAPNAQRWLEIGELACELGRIEQAQRRLLAAFEALPSNDTLHDAPDATAERFAAYRRFATWIVDEARLRVSNPAWHAIFEACPDDDLALVNLGVTLQRQGYPTLATRLAERAIALRPRSVAAHVNLGSALADLGRFEDAHAAYRRVIEIDPSFTGAASNALFCLHFEPSVTPERLLAEHLAFARRFADPLAPVARRAPRSRDPERRLRVGYVSPDLRRHPVGFFLEPVLAQHDPEGFEIYCYSDALRPDETTARLGGLSARFVDSAKWPDARLAEQIAEDEVDILVDLAGHTARNRLLVFARRPSPIQVSWLGYFDTTGLAAIDYRIADEHSLPPELERQFVERVVRLPRSSNCFLHPAAPEAAPPPCLERGFVTFGCFNNPAKLTREVIATFARILRGSHASRLLLEYSGFDDPGLGERFRGWLGEEGIGPERVDWVGHLPLGRFLASFARVDIALDPFPYSGETTALHTLWMGVPLVAIEGPTLVQRLASRVLRVAGLDGWVARTPDEYVRLALGLAADRAGLASWRASLRAGLEASPLFDHRGVTRELEAAYREMWRRQCARGA